MATIKKVSVGKSSIAAKENTTGSSLIHGDLFIDNFYGNVNIKGDFSGQFDWEVVGPPTNVVEIIYNGSIPMYTASGSADYTKLFSTNLSTIQWQFGIDSSTQGRVTKSGTGASIDSSTNNIVFGIEGGNYWIDFQVKPNGTFILGWEVSYYGNASNLSMVITIP